MISLRCGNVEILVEIHIPWRLPHLDETNFWRQPQNTPRHILDKRVIRQSVDVVDGKYFGIFVL